MTHLGYLIAGWGISLVVIFAYVISLFRRARSVALVSLQIDKDG